MTITERLQQAVPRFRRPSPFETGTVLRPVDVCPYVFMGDTLIALTDYIDETGQIDCLIMTPDGPQKKSVPVTLVELA
jgi:hypothetical protein